MLREGTKPERPLTFVLTMLYVAAASALGGMSRFLVSGLVGRAVGETFPWGTLVVNVSGAFTIGVVAALAPQHAALAGFDAWNIVVIGFLGSYTTVSSFSLQTLNLIAEGEWQRAAGNVVGSLVLCLSAVAAGFVLGGVAVTASW